MNMDLLYSLPALAVAICLTGAVLPSTRASRFAKYGSQRRRYSKLTVLTARFTVFALLLATVITLVWPVPGVDSLFQGLVITFICLVPLIAYLCVTFAGRLFFGKSSGSSRRRRRRHEGSHKEAVAEAAGNLPRYSVDADDTDTVLMHPAGSDTTNPATQIQAGVHRRPDLEVRPSTSAAASPVASRSATIETPDAAAAQSEGVASELREDAHAGADELAQAQESLDSSQNQDPEMKEQMDRVSTLVKSYDLGDERSDGAKRESRALKRNNLSETASTQSTDLASHNEQALQVSRTEALRKVIATLQEDKRKLQRLVIAQQAAFDSERQSHERTRHVARDAIKVMRDARSGQRMAEKIARRERAERRRLEKEYTKVTKALKNAMSTLASAEKDNTSAA